MKFAIGLLVAIVMIITFVSCFSDAGFVLTYYFWAIVAFIVFGVMIYYAITTLFKK